MWTTSLGNKLSQLESSLVAGQILVWAYLNKATLKLLFKFWGKDVLPQRGGGICFFCAPWCTHLQHKARHNRRTWNCRCRKTPRPLCSRQISNSGLQSFFFFDVGTLVGSCWDAWKTPIPSEKHKGLHEGIAGVGLDQGWPSRENLA